MKKYTLICAAVCAAMVFTSCKSSESAYKQAYLKAKQQEELQQRQQAEQQTAAVQQVENAVVAPLEEKSANQTQVVDNGDNVHVRQETVSVVNAEGLQQTLKKEGYNAQVVVNNNVEPAMYRVVATTFATKGEAVSSRASLQAKYPGAWLLYAK